jgi:hypothetical protein
MNRAWLVFGYEGRTRGRERSEGGSEGASERKNIK